MPGPTTAPDDAMTTAVHERYAAAARAELDGPSRARAEESKDPITRGLYEPSAVPSDSALSASLGSGNPTALTDLSPGEVVLDLGSGGGLDVLLSARRVGPTGTAYGLDMVPEMLDLARRNQREAGIENARFLLGSIEDVPLPDASVDVVISNCVINLSHDKDAVLREARRVLRPGGRFAVSDIVLLRPIPPELSSVVALFTGCISGALHERDYVSRLIAAGLVDASVQVTRTFGRADLVDLAETLAPADLADLPAGLDLDAAVDVLAGAFASAFIRATKPA